MLFLSLYSEAFLLVCVDFSDPVEVVLVPSHPLPIKCLHGHLFVAVNQTKTLILDFSVEYFTACV